MNRFHMVGVAMLAATLATPAFAQAELEGLEALEKLAIPVENREGQLEDIGRAWFIELKSLPEVEGTKANRLRAERQAFRAAALAAGVPLQSRAEYGTLFNGFSVVANRSQIAKLRGLPGVVNVFPVVEVKREEAVDMGTALAMTGADITQNTLGLTGLGVRVAVMDTGIDYDHPDLGGCFGPGCKVARGWDFVGDAYGSGGSVTAYPDDDPDDCGGHGTHVAGIIGANGAVKGVAPHVSLSAYRVFGCSGSTSADIMLQAMEAVWRDRNQVLNMSIGSALQWPKYPTAVGAQRLSRRGVVVVTSIGNSGDPTQSSYRGLFAAGAPGVSPGAIGVASAENTHMMFPALTASDGTTTVTGGYTVSSNAPAPPADNSTMPLTRSGTQATTNDLCAAVPAGTFSGKAVLVRRGTCGFYWKAYNAMSAGATAVVLYNNTTGTLTPSTDPTTASPVGTTAINIPVVMLQQVDGNAIDTLIAAGAPVTLTWTDGFKQYANPSSGIMSAFTSLGPANDMTFKPNVAAPGGNIFSTYPLELGGYANLSGTSMASPHTAGAVALMLQAMPRLKHDKVLARLQNTADWVKFGLTGAASTRPAPVNRQGAGLIDIDDAITSKVQIVPSQLALGEFETSAITKTVNVRIVNQGATDTFTVTYRYAYETYGSNFTPSTTYVGGCTLVNFSGASSASVTVPMGGVADVPVTFSANAGCIGANLILGGFLEINGASGTKRSVPWMGYAGDMQRNPMPTSGSLAPSLRKYNTGTSTYDVVNVPTTYTMTDWQNVPTFWLHLDEPTPRLLIQVKPAAALSWRNAVVEEWLQRNNSSGGLFAWEWYGYVRQARLPLPDGTYDAQVCATLRLNNPNADPSSGAKQCIALPQIIIDRP